MADWGVAPGSLQSSYAMAENVFAVTRGGGHQPDWLQIR